MQTGIKKFHLAVLGLEYFLIKGRWMQSNGKNVLVKKGKRARAHTPFHTTCSIQQISPLL